jgi:beta-phosphoglucomutase
MNIKYPKACIFDLDGVIVDTAKYHYLAWRALATELGFEFTQEHNERLKGVSRIRSLEIMLEVGNVTLSEEEKFKVADKKNAIYVSYIEKMTPDEILPGVLNFLNIIRSKGIKTALGSASKNTPLILERTNLKKMFDVVVDGNMVSKAKPDPEVFLKGAELLLVDSAKCCVFEDAFAGVEAAHRAGMHCVGIGNQDVLSEADIIIPGFANVSPNTLFY